MKPSLPDSNGQIGGVGLLIAPIPWFPCKLTVPKGNIVMRLHHNKSLTQLFVVAAPSLDAGNGKCSRRDSSQDNSGARARPPRNRRQAQVQ